MKTLNYYILLGLSFNPPEEDENVIRKTLNDKRAQWSNLINHPTKKNEARMYLDSIADIERVMIKDPAARLKEAVKARDIFFQRERKEEKLFSSVCSVILSKGYVTESEYKDIKKRFILLDEVVIKNKLEHYVRSINNRKDVIDDIIYKKIRKNLDIIKEDSLYTFLKCANTDTVYELQEATDKIYEEIRKVANKDSKVTAKGELQGLCRIIFKNKNSKLQYDEGMKREKLSYVYDILNVCGSKKIIEYSEYNSLLDIIKSEGFSQMESREFIIDYCIKNKVTLIVDEKVKVYDATKEDEVQEKREEYKKPEVKRVYYKGQQRTVEDPKSNNFYNAFTENKYSDMKKNTEVEGYKYEVDNLTTKNGDGFIKISWKLLNFKHKVEVWKKEGEIPMERGDGALLCTTSGNEIYDYKVKNGKTYGYLIKVFYRKNNVEYETEGKTCFDTPTEMLLKKYRRKNNQNMISRIRRLFS